VRLLTIALLLAAPAIAQTEAVDATAGASFNVSGGILASPAAAAPHPSLSLSPAPTALSPVALSAAPSALFAPAAAPIVLAAAPAAVAAAAPPVSSPAAAPAAGARTALDVVGMPSAPNADVGRAAFDGDFAAPSAPDVASFGARVGQWFGARLQSWAERPRVAYRGARGALIIPRTEPTAAQRDNLQRIQKLVWDYRRTGAHPVSADAVRLIDYYAKWLLDTREANFNLSAGEARDWANNGDVDLAHIRSFSQTRDWASRVIDELQNTRYVLKADMPRGQKYWVDRFQDSTFGVMTRVPRSRLAAIPPERLIDRVGYKKKWLRPDDPRVAAHWKPLFAFSDAAVAALQNAGPDADLESLAAQLKSAYDKSGLGAVPVAER